MAQIENDNSEKSTEQQEVIQVVLEEEKNTDAELAVSNDNGQMKLAGVSEQEHNMLKHLIKSKVLPSSIKTVETAYAVTMFGKELGFSTMQSFTHIVLISGKPTISAVACNALMRRAGIIIRTIHDGHYIYPNGEYSYFKKEESEKPLDRVTTLEVTRNGITELVSFSWKDAILQELNTKDNWKRMP